jgi:hypothetical protein
MNKVTKKNKANKNSKTKKCKPSDKQLQVYCSKSSDNTLKSFEKDLEKDLKAKGLWKDNFDVEEELIQVFKTPFTPSKYNQKNDFYNYINYQWIAKKSDELKSVQKYYVQVDSFRIGQEKVYYELIDIVKDYIKNNNTSKSRALKNVYESLLNLDDSATADYVGWAVKRIDQIFASNSVYRMIAEIDQNEIIAWGSPIVWSVMPDEKNSKIYSEFHD